jgi:hypothetical protein
VTTTPVRTSRRRRCAYQSQAAACLQVAGGSVLTDRRRRCRPHPGRSRGRRSCGRMRDAKRKCECGVS